MIGLNNCDMKDWTRELTLPNYYPEVMLYGGGRGGGKSYDIKPATTEYPLTDSETSPRIEPSNLLIKLIGRI